MESGNFADAQLRALIDVAAVAAGAYRLEEVLELAGERALEALGGSSLAISRWDLEAGVVRTLVNVGELGPGEERFPKDETYSVNDYPSVVTVMREGGSSLAYVDDPEYRLGAARAAPAARQGVEPVGPDDLSRRAVGRARGHERAGRASADGPTTRPSCAPSRTCSSARSTGRSCSPRSRRSPTPTRSRGSPAGALSRPRSRRLARRRPAAARRRSCSATSTTSSR